MAERHERITLRCGATRGPPHLWSATVLAEDPDRAIVRVEWGRRGGATRACETRVGPDDVRPPCTTVMGQAREHAQRLARAKITKGYTIVSSRSTTRVDGADPRRSPAASAARFQDAPLRWTRSDRVFAQPIPQGLRASLRLGPDAEPRLTLAVHGTSVPLDLVEGLASATSDLARLVGANATLHGFLVARRDSRGSGEVVIGPGDAAEAVRTGAKGALDFFVADAFVPSRPDEPFDAREARIRPGLARVSRSVGAVPTSCIRGATLSTFYVECVLNGHEGAVYRLPDAVASPDPGARSARVAEHIEGGQGLFRVRGVVAQPAARDRLAAVVLETPDREPFRAKVRLSAGTQAALLRDRADLPGRTAITWFDEWDPARPGPPKGPVVVGVL